MQDSTEAIARRILESVLRQLNDAAPPLNQAADATSRNPVILILTNGPQTKQSETDLTPPHTAASHGNVQPSNCGCQNNSHTVSNNSLQSPHPGQEQFNLPEHNVVSDAPRKCFIEPDRVCVGSGACKMRGY